jgi:hypothetical protein
MANIVELWSKQNDRRRRDSIVISAGIVLLAAMTLVCASLVSVPLWAALVQGWRFEPIADRCKMLRDAGATETCDEKLRVEGIQHPARGAKAPIMLQFPEGQNQ